MASAAARAARNQEARVRLKTVLDEISDRLEIEIPDEPKRMRDPDLQPVVELERWAEILEAILEKLGPGEVRRVPTEYDGWSVAMLREEIAHRKLDKKGSKRDELIAILEEDNLLRAEAGIEEEGDS